MKSCFCLILLLMASAVFSATKIELQSDKSASAEIVEDKGKQLVSVSLTFMPVSTLDAVTNDEMTGVLAQFFTEEALSSYLKCPKAVAFSKARCVVHKKTAKQCSLTYEIPIAAISDADVKQQSIPAESIKKYFASVSSDALLQDFRSTCFYDLRIAEAVFLEQIKSCKDKEKLARKINDAFSALNRKINSDDALFLSEKEELLTKANSVKSFLLKKLSSAPVAATESTSCPNAQGSPNIVHGTFLPEFKPFLLSDPILLEVGGCKAFRTEDGKTVLIAVGIAEVKDQSAKDRIRRQKVAEQKAFGELAKHQEVEVTFFSERYKTTSILSQNGVESGSSQKISSSRITMKAEAYFDEMLTVGRWYSGDGKLFFLAKGCIIPKK